MKRFPLIQVVLTTTLAAGIAAAIAMAYATSAQIEAMVETQLTNRAEVYANSLLLEANVATDRRQIHRKVRMLGSHRDVLDLAVVGGDPLTVLGSTNQDWINLALHDVRGDWEKRFRLEDDLRAQHSLDVVRREFHYALPFSLTNLNDPELRSTPTRRVAGAVLVRLDPSDFLGRAKQQHRLLLFATMGTVFCLLAVLVATMMRHVILPMKSLRRRLGARVEGHGDRTPPLLPNQDMQSLGDTIWSLFDQAELSSDHMRAIVSCATDAIITIDEDGKVLLFNPGAEKMFLCTANQAVGQSLSRFIPPDFRSQHDNSMRAVADGRKPRILGFAREVMALRTDGSTFPCSLAVNAAIIRGNQCYVGILRDMTEDLRTRKELDEARQQAELGARAKASFLANMSHEIRTPLTAIIGYSEELESSAMTPSDRHDALQVIQRNGQHLMTIINDILDLSKIEAGSMGLETRATNVVEIAEEVRRMLSPRARAKGLALDLRLAQPLPSTILSDPTRIRQILLNLVGNAIKFTDRGSVTIEVSADYAAQLCRLSVKDTGIGISKDQLATLFQSFAQADSSISRKYGGTGLGLDISKRLAAMLGGDLKVTSAVGYGSTFVCSIATGPIEPSQSTVLPPQEERVRRTAPRLAGRVLVADDGIDNQRLIERILQVAGLEVEVVDNGAAAVERVLQAASSQPFDAILMDMQMPVMDGIEATKTLRGHGYSGPIIALTANVLPEDRARCAEAGCSGFATKPIDRTHLYEALGAALTKR